MRVVYLSPSCLPIVGGTETALNDLAASLIKHGISVETIALCNQEKWHASRRFTVSATNGGRVLIWPAYPIGPLRTVLARTFNAHLFPACLSALNAYVDRFDVIHFHDDVDLSFPFSCLHSSTPKLFSCQNLQDDLDRYLKNQIARNVLIRSADLFHVLSTADVRSLGALGVKRDRIRVVPRGADINKFKPSRKTISRDNVYTITFVGRIERRKGVAVLLDAIDILKRKYSKPRLKVVIAGPVSDSRYYQELLAFAKQKQLHEVKFAGSLVDLAVADLLRRSDIFVCPSLSETFGTVNVEAMASGLPVIATSVGGIPDIIVNNQTGFLVRPRDASELAEKLSRLMFDAELREKMGRMGRIRAESLFSLERVVLQMISVYMELASWSR